MVIARRERPASARAPPHRRGAVHLRVRTSPTRHATATRARVRSVAGAGSGIATSTTCTAPGVPSATSSERRARSRAVDGDAVGDDRRDGEVEQQASNTTLVAASSTARPAMAREVDRDHGSEERGVGGAAAELAGDDRHLDPRRQRTVALAAARAARTTPNAAPHRPAGRDGSASSRSSTVFGPRSATSEAALRCSSSCSSEYRVSIATPSPSLPAALAARGPQRLLLDLARRVHRQLVDELDDARHLVVRHRGA